MMTGPVSHINITFYRMQVVYKLKCKQMVRQKWRDINAINHLFDFDYVKGITIETWEDVTLIWIDRDLVGVYKPHYDPVMISTHVGLWRVAMILVDEGSGYGLLFSNYIMGMNPPQYLITPDTGDVYSLGSSKSYRVGHTIERHNYKKSPL